LPAGQQGGLEWPPDAYNVDALDWLLERRIERAREKGGEDAALAVVREKAKEVLYSRDRGPVFLFSYLSEHGGPSELSILEKWMGRFPPNARETRFLIHGSCAPDTFWYALKKRLCSTDAERRALARSLIDPLSPLPECDLWNLTEELASWRKEAREWVYQVLMRKEDLPYPLGCRREALLQLLDLPEYSPSPEEIDQVMGGGGEFGRYAVARLLLFQRDPRGRRYLVETLKRRDLSSFLLALDLAVDTARSRDWEVLRLIVGNVEFALGLPLSGPREEALQRAMGHLYEASLSEWPEALELIAPLCRRFLDLQNELRWVEVEAFGRKPGTTWATEAEDMIRFREMARGAAAACLTKCGETAEQERKNKP
jgi:hypothetical protein